MMQENRKPSPSRVRDNPWDMMFDPLKMTAMRRVVGLSKTEVIRRLGEYGLPTSWKRFSQLEVGSMSPPSGEFVELLAEVLMCDWKDIMSYPSEILSRHVSDNFFEYENVCLFIDEQERLLRERYAKKGEVPLWRKLQKRQRRMQRLLKK